MLGGCLNRNTPFAMKLHLTTLLALAAASLNPSAQAQTAYPATLAGHALLPAMTVIPAPKDAPADLRVSGKFTTGQRVEKIGSVEGLSAGRPTGVSLPFKGQPLQGSLTIPGDKSVSHRAVMLGALAEGVTRVTGFLEGEDTRATAAVFARLGVAIDAPGPGERLAAGQHGRHLRVDGAR